MNRLQQYVSGFIIGVTALVLLYSYHYVSQLRGERDAAIYGQLNAEARYDTLRSLNDSVSLRLAIQQRLTNDANARAAQWQQTAARARTVVTVRPDSATTTAPVRRDGTNYTAHFDSYQPPMRLRADATVGPVGGDARLHYEWQLDPIALTAQVGCRDAVGGIHRAEVLLVTPAWVRVDSIATQADPRICNPPRGARHSWLLTTGAGTVAGALVAFLSKRSLLEGAAVGAGVGLALHLSFRGN